MADPLTPDTLMKLHACWRAANDLSVGQIYLQDNAMLDAPLTLVHIKPRLLGHWGRAPGLNLICVHLNRLIKENDLNMIYVMGPGHGGPGIVAHSCLEGSYTEHHPARDGAVLTILLLNGYKIANPTLLARISREELTDLMRGYGHEPLFVEGDDPALVHQALAGVLDAALAQIRQFQQQARATAPGQLPERLPKRPRGPMIVLRTPKGWTGPKRVDGKPVEGHWRSHHNWSSSKAGSRVAGPRNCSTKAVASLTSWPRWHRPASVAWAATRTPMGVRC